MRMASRVPPGAYKVVCVGHKIVTSKADITGMELLLKIVKPIKRRDPSSGRLIRTEEEVIRHVFWMTKYALAYHMRDAHVILGHPLKSMSKFARSAGWIGKTCEVNVKGETYGGAPVSRVHFFDTWKPKQRSSGGAL